jgi:hypothetical protein
MGVHSGTRKKGQPAGRFQRLKLACTLLNRNHFGLFVAVGCAHKTPQNEP